MKYNAILHLYNDGQNEYDAETKAQNQLYQLIEDLPMLKIADVLNTHKDKKGYVSKCYVSYIGKYEHDLEEQIFHSNIHYINYDVEFETFI